MKYTRSKDGIDRCTVIIKERFTREEYATLANFAKQQGMTVQSFVNSHMNTEQMWEYIFEMKAGNQ